MSVNGSVVTELGTKVDLDVDRVVVNGRPLPRPQKRYYIALNKPRGVLSAVSDPHGMRTVTSLVELQSRPLLRPVGRLDVDSDGLIFLTDDGDFLNKLTHPRHKVGKTYTVVVEGAPDEDALRKLAEGVRLEDGMTLPARDVRLRRKYREDEGQRAVVDLTIFEGRNRQVRRMFDALGHRVLRLTRSAIGSVRLTGLPPGGWRHLTPKEVEALLAGAAAEPRTSSEEKPCQTEQSPSRPTKARSSPRSSKARRPSPPRTSSNSPRRDSTTG